MLKASFFLWKKSNGTLGKWTNRARGHIPWVLMILTFLSNHYFQLVILVGADMVSMVRGTSSTRFFAISWNWWYFNNPTCNYGAHWTYSWHSLSRPSTGPRKIVEIMKVWDSRKSRSGGPMAKKGQDNQIFTILVFEFITLPRGLGQVLVRQKR